MIHGKETECTLFVQGEEIRIRAGDHEYVILGTTGLYGLPIPVTTAMIRESTEEGTKDHVTAVSEEGMTGVSVDIPNVVKGDIVLRDEDIVRYIETLKRNDGSSPVLTVLRGEVDLGGMKTIRYDQTPCALRVREVTKK